MGYFGLDEQTVMALLLETRRPWKYYREAPPEWSGYEGFFKNEAEVERFLAGLPKEPAK